MDLPEKVMMNKVASRLVSSVLALIIELVDSVSGEGPDTPICNTLQNVKQLRRCDFLRLISDIPLFVNLG